MSVIDPIRPKPGVPYQELVGMAFMPMLISANWWTTAFQLWCPPGIAETRHQGRHELAVPDPVERDGEHALFA